MFTGQTRTSVENSRSTVVEVKVKEMNSYIRSILQKFLGNLFLLRALQLAYLIIDFAVLLLCRNPEMV